MTQIAAPRPWRCFVAVALSDDFREALRAWVAEVRQDASFDADWRWADPEGWHITLAFLGATSPDAVAGIAERLTADLADRRGFSLTTGGVGAFPGHSRARVLWYGIHDVERRLAELAGLVRTSAGTDTGAPFRPHVTLARARDRHGSPVPSLPVERLPATEIPVAGVALMRSHLGSGPAHYETLAEIPLVTPVAAVTPA